MQILQATTETFNLQVIAKQSNINNFHGFFVLEWNPTETQNRLPYKLYQHYKCTSFVASLWQNNHIKCVIYYFQAHILNLLTKRNSAMVSHNIETTDNMIQMIVLSILTSMDIWYQLDVINGMMYYQLTSK